MHLTISTEHYPASNVGHLLHEDPERFQSFDQNFGHSYVFHPEVTKNRSTIILFPHVHPVGIVHGKKRDQSILLGHYANDRPYVVSSFMSVAIAQVFGTAMGRRCKDRPERVTTPIPLTAWLDVLLVRGGEEILHRCSSHSAMRLKPFGIRSTGNSRCGEIARTLRSRSVSRRRSPNCSRT